MKIDKNYINNILREAEKIEDDDIEKILKKAENFKGLTHREVASLLKLKDDKYLNRIFKIAGNIKKEIYGNRIVIFAPLYISDYCINNCSYCGYKGKNEFHRNKLTMNEIREEVEILEKMGHKRLALEVGEHPIKADIDYILESIKTIYNMKFENGEIRRLNINIAGTTVENYKKLKDADIGTYILFQETYDTDNYNKFHISGPKADYDYHLNSFDRAMQAGIDDVGGGVLFGLSDPFFEVIAMMMHNEHLENEYGVGFHTISVPRICKIEGEDFSKYEHILDDKSFEKIVAILRIAVPYTGMILSTRENDRMRKRLMEVGISQISAGSSVGVGGYSKSKQSKSQFEVTDHRTAKDIIDALLVDGYIPSFCTACYRNNRTGDRFMKLAKSGNIKNVCTPNALMTLAEYMMDYGDDKTREYVEKIIEKEVKSIEDEKVKNMVLESIEKIKQGKRDLYI